MKNENSIDRIIQVNDSNIGNNIATLRKSLNIKQTDMIARLQTDGIDISIYSYNRIEKGTQNPTVSFLYACCRILNCDMNTIFNFHVICNSFYILNIIIIKLAICVLTAQKGQNILLSDLLNICPVLFIIIIINIQQLP